MRLTHKANPTVYHNSWLMHRLMRSLVAKLKETFIFSPVRYISLALIISEHKNGGASLPHITTAFSLSFHLKCSRFLSDHAYYSAMKSNLALNMLATVNGILCWGKLQQLLQQGDCYYGMSNNYLWVLWVTLERLLCDRKHHQTHWIVPPRSVHLADDHRMQHFQSIFYRKEASSDLVTIRFFIEL